MQYAFCYFHLLLCVIAGLPTYASAYELSTDHYTVTFDNFPHSLVTLYAGQGSYHILDGFGPVVFDNSKNIEPTSYRVRMLAVRPLDDGVRVTYRVDQVQESHVFSITYLKTKDGLKLIVDGIAGAFSGIHPGHMANTPQLVGWNVPTRMTEDYAAHSIYPDIFYHRGCGLWFRGRWDLNVSHASSHTDPWGELAEKLKGKNAAWFPGMPASKGDKPSVSPHVYYLDTALLYPEIPVNGRHRLHEVFNLSISDHLWAAVPQPPNKPSDLKPEMSKLMYVDIFGGRATTDQRFNFTKQLQDAVGKWVGGLCIVQVWQGQGFDKNEPISITSQVPPSPTKTGTPAQFEAWLRQMRSWGLVGLRTNYQAYRDQGSIEQDAKRAITLDGQPKWDANMASVMKDIARQEAYIKSHYHTTATFSDQMGSCGPGWVYVDYTQTYPQANTISEARNALRRQVKLIHDIIGGPLLSESCSAQFLLGQYIDSGDYGIFKGYERNITPEYKLRRLQSLLVCYGMGLGYRYFEAPPYNLKKRTEGKKMYLTRWGAGRDDYRAMTIAYGNGAYCFWKSSGHYLDRAVSEAMTVGLIQKYYLNTSVKSIAYLDSGQWKTVEQLLLEGVNPEQYFQCMKIEYQNDLVVYVNRNHGPLHVVLPKFGDIMLPKHAYAAYLKNGMFEAFSGVPGKTNDPNHRIDYTSDHARHVTFIDPRRSHYHDLKTATIYDHGKRVYPSH